MASATGKLDWQGDVDGLPALTTLMKWAGKYVIGMQSDNEAPAPKDHGIAVVMVGSSSVRVFMTKGVNWRRDWIHEKCHDNTSKSRCNFPAVVIFLTLHTQYGRVEARQTGVKTKLDRVSHCRFKRMITLKHGYPEVVRSPPHQVRKPLS